MPVVPVPVPTPAAPVGFAANGAGNAALKAMLARIAAGTGRGRIDFAGDSTTAGAGAGSDAGRAYLPGARRYRPSKVFASLLTAAGWQAHDEAVIGDNGCLPYCSLPDYDPRVTMGTTDSWTIQDGGTPRHWSGGNLIVPAAGFFEVAPEADVDSFEVLVYDVAQPALTLTIDDAPPLSVTVTGGLSASVGVVAIPGAGGGFARIVARAAAPGRHRLRITGGNGGAVRGVDAYDSTRAAIGIRNNACSGASAAEQASAGAGFRCNDALGDDAPDLTIVNLGLNDINNRHAVTDYTAALQTIITTARSSGDVLLVFPHPAGEGFAIDAATYRDAAAAVAAADGVAFLSLFDYFGGAFTPALQARLADGVVHGDAGFYAEVADVYRRSILAMLA